MEINSHFARDHRSWEVPGRDGGADTDGLFLHNDVTICPGRSGAILAPVLIGVLVSLRLPLQHNFMEIAVPAVHRYDRRPGDQSRPVRAEEK